MGSAPISFRHGYKLAEALIKLATSYYEALCDGKGDAEGAALFGDDFAAKESGPTMKNKRARAERTFIHEGQELVMWRHLRLGVKESVAETIRVHFEWISDQRRIVIGWCGEHRYRVG